MVNVLLQTSTGRLLWHERGSPSDQDEDDLLGYLGC